MSVAALVINILGNTSGLTQALSTAQASLQGFSGSLQSAGGKLRGGITNPLQALATASVKAAAGQEQLRIAFTTMLGSAERADALIRDLAQFSAQTPFEMPEVVAAGKQLLAFGIAAEDVQDALRRLGDIGAGVGSDIGDLAYLYGTANAQGRLFMADINQFSNRGIPIIEALAQTMGVATNEVRKLVEEGKVGFPELQAALAYLTDEGGQFAGLMAAQSQSLMGLWSTLNDTIGLALTAIGAKIVETFDLNAVLEKALEALDEFVSGLLAFADANPVLFRTVLLVSTAAAALGPLVVGMAAVASGVAFLMPGLAALVAVIGALLSPVALVTAGVVALAAAFWRFDVGGIPSAIKEVVGALREYVATVLEAGPSSLAAAAAFGALPAPLQTVVSAVQSFVAQARAFIAQVAEAGAAVWEWVSSVRAGGILAIAFTANFAALPDPIRAVAVALLTAAIRARLWVADAQAAIATLAQMGASARDAMAGFAVEKWQAMSAALAQVTTVDPASLGRLSTALTNAQSAAMGLVPSLQEIGSATAALVTGEMSFGAYAETVKAQLEQIAETIRAWAAGFDWGSLLQSASNAGEQIQETVAGWFAGIDFAGATAGAGASLSGLQETVAGWFAGLDWQAHLEGGRAKVEELAATVGSWFAGIDWQGGLADAQARVNALTETVSGWFTSTDWAGVAEQGKASFENAVNTVNGWRDRLLAAMTSAVEGVDWSGMSLNFTGFIDRISAAIDGIDFSGTDLSGTLAGKLTGWWSVAISTAQWVAESDQFSGLVTAVGNAIGSITWSDAAISLTGLVEEVAGALVELKDGLVKGLTERITGIDWAQASFDFSNLLSRLSAAIRDADWEGIGQNFGETIRTLFVGSDESAGVFSGLADAVKQAIAGIRWGDVLLGSAELLGSLTDAIFGLITGAINGLFGTSLDIDKIPQPQWVADLSAWLTGVASPPPWVATIAAWWSGVKNGTPAFSLALTNWWNGVTTGAVTWVTTLTDWWAGVTTTPAWVTSIESWLSSLKSWSWPTIPRPEWVNTVAGWFSSVGSILPNIGGNQLGTAYWRGGPTWVGEGGPELVYLPRGAQVLPHRESVKAAGATGAVNVSINATVANDIDIYDMARQIKEVLNRGY